MCEKIASYLAKHSELGSKNFKQNLPENYSKNTKIAITACKFLKFLRGSMPPNPLKIFLFLNQFQICSVEKKIHLKKYGNIGLPLLKFLATLLGPVDPSSYSLTPIRPLGVDIDHFENHYSTITLEKVI